MKFYGKGLVWDKSNNRILCRFVGGVYETKDQHKIDSLVDAGFKHDKIPPKGKVKK